MRLGLAGPRPTHEPAFGAPGVSRTARLRQAFDLGVSADWWQANVAWNDS